MEMQGVNELQAAVGVLVLVLGGSELNPNLFPQSAMWLVPSCGPLQYLQQSRDIKHNNLLVLAFNIKY